MLTQATPILEALSRDTGDAAHLAIRSRHEIVVIARRRHRDVAACRPHRHHAPGPCHAIGSSELLAEVPAETLESLLDQLDFKRFTKAQRSLRARPADRTLPEVRATGVAYDNGELDDDIKCVAMPVRRFRPARQRGDRLFQDRSGAWGRAS
ncbi:MAG: hypothetical protein H6891_01390 [Brucellaceae bacterium]|nr:hypothetical protein [Brucellaceae bacterium]